MVSLMAGKKNRNRGQQDNAKQEIRWSEKNTINIPPDYVFALTKRIQDNKSLRHMKKMENALAYILSHLENCECTIDKAAEAAGYESSYFQRIFTRYYEMPFAQFVTRLRLRAAAKAIATEAFPKKVGLRFNFANPQSFSKAFRREFGVSPRNFQEENYDIPDMPLRKQVEGIEISLEYKQVYAIRVVGCAIRAPYGNETPLLDFVSLPYEKDLLTSKEKSGADKVGI